MARRRREPMVTVLLVERAAGRRLSALQELAVELASILALAVLLIAALQTGVLAAIGQWIGEYIAQGMIRATPAAS